MMKKFKRALSSLRIFHRVRLLEDRVRELYFQPPRQVGDAEMENTNINKIIDEWLNGEEKGID